MTQTTLKEFLCKLNKNCWLLKDREAKYGGLTSPLSFINQIEDYERAIQLTVDAIEQDTGYEDLQDALAPLNLDIHERIQIEVIPARKEFTGQNPYRGLERFNEENAAFSSHPSLHLTTHLSQLQD